MGKVRSRWEEFAEHEHRPDVGGEHKYGDVLQGLLLLLFIAASIFDYFVLKTHLLLAEYIPWWVRISISLVLLVVGWRLAKDGLQAIFGDVREKPTVIYQGALTQIRHPIYLGAILMYLAAVVLTLSLAASAVWILIIACYAFLAKHEEKLLIEKIWRGIPPVYAEWFQCGSRDRRLEACCI